MFNKVFQLEAKNAFATKSDITPFSLQLEVSSNPLQSTHRTFAWIQTPDSIVKADSGSSWNIKPQAAQKKVPVS